MPIKDVVALLTRIYKAENSVRDDYRIPSTITAAELQKLKDAGTRTARRHCRTQNALEDTLLEGAIHCGPSRRG